MATAKPNTPPPAESATTEPTTEEQLVDVTQRPGTDTTEDALRAENTRLRAQLAAAGQPARTAAPEHTFQLSEGDRQELEIRGVINWGGRSMTKADVEKAMKAAGQRGVEIADAPEGTRVSPGPDADLGAGVRGIDYVYPSVERGKLDPAVAGTPGISGPAAGDDK